MEEELSSLIYIINNKGVSNIFRAYIEDFVYESDSVDEMIEETELTNPTKTIRSPTIFLGLNSYLVKPNNPK